MSAVKSINIVTGVIMMRLQTAITTTIKDNNRIMMIDTTIENETQTAITTTIKDIRIMMIDTTIENETHD